MADERRQSALAGHYYRGAFGGDGRHRAGVVLSERRPGALLQINGAPPEAQLQQALGGLGLRPAPEIRRSCAGDGVTLIWNGPGMWLVDAPQRAPGELLASLQAALVAGDATVTDLSHARTVVHVAGPGAADLLARGCPVDIESLEPHDCAATLLGHLNVLVNTVDDGFDIYVFRSFGLALWEWLLREAEEHGYQIG